MRLIHGAVTLIAANLVKNRSFESPVVAAPCPKGGMVGLTSTTHWQAAESNQSVDLSGNAPGSMTQEVSTVSGTAYVLGWHTAGNPDCGSSVKTMNVYWNGVQVDSVEFNTSGHTDSSMGWTYQHINVTATGQTSSIEFADATSPASSCGAVLDAVSLKTQ
jgi:hypothetical protein